jgi:hypothetical protein
VIVRVHFMNVGILLGDAECLVTLAGIVVTDVNHIISISFAGEILVGSNPCLHVSFYLGVATTVSRHEDDVQASSFVPAAYSCPEMRTRQS